MSNSMDACFTVRDDANPQSRKLHLTRFQENPQAFWGPKARAKSGYRTQGKRLAGRWVTASLNHMFSLLQRRHFLQPAGEKDQVPKQEEESKR